MPVTPFHFGLGVALHSAAPRSISLLAFCGANVLIDIEPLYFMITGQHPLHRFFHTYIGASIVAVGTVVLFVISQRVARRFSFPNDLGWQDPGLWPIAIGATAGTYSHIVLDSIMHSDITPFAPFSKANPLLHAIGLGSLHLFCLAAGLVGACVLGIRYLSRLQGRE